MLRDSVLAKVTGPRSLIKLDELIAACEALYARDGFVKWSEIAETYGISRQAVHARFKAAIERGDLSEADFERWRSVSSRRAQSKVNLELKRERERCNLSITLSPENVSWLRKECLARRASSSDVLNGLITKARNAL